MDRQRHPIIDIIDDHAASSDIGPFLLKKFSQLKACYDQTLGHHTLKCEDCEETISVPNTCKGLHCPFCSYVKTQRWIEARRSEVLNCRYFHNVFTLPHEFNDIFKSNFKFMSNILFASVTECLNTFFDRDNKKSKPGFMLILHTWDQKLDYHFHIHAVIAGGYLDRNGKWVDVTKGKDKKFLFPVKALQNVFRGIFLRRFNEAIQNGDISWEEDIPLPTFLSYVPKNWVVYSEHAHGDPTKVIEYLGRYTHKAGLSKSKIRYTGDAVYLRVKNRRNGTYHEIEMIPSDFLKRFGRHFFAEVVQRVRYYGFLSNASKKNDLKIIENQIGTLSSRIADHFLPKCPACGSTRLKFLGGYWRSAPLLLPYSKQATGPPSFNDLSAFALSPLAGRPIREDRSCGQ